jgi:hypothetical protein
VDGRAAQLGGGGLEWVGMGGRQRRRHAGGAEARGQQVVAAAVIGSLGNGAQVCGLCIEGDVLAIPTATGGENGGRHRGGNERTKPCLHAHHVLVSWYFSSRCFLHS